MNNAIHDPKIKYIHQVNTGITACYRINNNDNSVTFAHSFTHGNDSYNKKRGREIVRGRLEKGGINQRGVSRNFTFALTDIDGSTKYKDVSKHVMFLICSNTSCKNHLWAGNND